MHRHSQGLCRSRAVLLGEGTAGLSDEFTAAVGKVPQCLPWEVEEAALRFLGEGWVGEGSPGPPVDQGPAE